MSKPLANLNSITAPPESAESTSPSVLVRLFPGVDGPLGGILTTGFVSFFYWERHVSRKSIVILNFFFFLIYLAKHRVHFQVHDIQDQSKLLILSGCFCLRPLVSANVTLTVSDSWIKLLSILFGSKTEWWMMSTLQWYSLFFCVCHDR